MDFTTLFRTKENLNLDKSTLTILRYIAIIGQFIAVNIVFFYLKLVFPIKACLIVIFLGLLTNLFLQFKVKGSQLKDTFASLFLLDANLMKAAVSLGKQVPPYGVPKLKKCGDILLSNPIASVIL